MFQNQDEISTRLEILLNPMLIRILNTNLNLPDIL